MREYMISYGTSKICKAIGKEIPALESKRDTIKFQLSKFKGKDPEWDKIGRDSLTENISECDRVIEILKHAYEEIVEGEYGVERSFVTTKDFMNEMTRNLYERGITGVEYEDIEPKNGEAMVRLYWTELVKDEHRQTK